MTATHTRLPDDLSIVVTLLDEQFSLYQRLKQLTEHQSMMVAQQKAEPLLEVLARRQGVIDQISEVNERFTPYREQWSAVRSRLEPSQREQVELRVQQVENLLEAIIDQDNKDRQQLQASHEQVATELKQVRNTGAGVSAYRKSGYGSAGGTNRQG